MGDVVQFPITCLRGLTVDHVCRDAASYCERGILILGYTSDLEPYSISAELDEEDIVELIKAFQKTLKKKKKPTSRKIPITD